MDDYKPAFSPAVYGWQNALELNCLQFVVEKGTSGFPITQQTDVRYMNSFTKMTGTEYDADIMSLSSFHYPRNIMYYVRNLHHGRHENTSLGEIIRDVFSSAINENGEFIRSLFTNQIMGLRKSIYFAPRHIAFLSGKHQRLGKDSKLSILSDDACRMILKFAAE